MDLLSVLRHFADQSVFGGLLVLTLVTGIVLLVRQIGKKDEAGTGAATQVEAKIDVETIEGAMKRVLASQGPVAATPAPVVINGGDDAAMNAALREREARIAELQSEIAKLRADIDNVQSLTGMTVGGGAAVDTGKISELEGKIDELKARLQEYEIIEDDIADLSLYKDENARLKHEIKRLREEAPEAAAAVPTAEEEAEKAKADAPPPPVLPEPTAEPVGDPAAELLAGEPGDEDDVMKQFASAVQVQKAPPPDAEFKVEANPFGTASPEAPAEEAHDADSPLAFELDPEKIMSEVSTLSAEAVADSALEETLDTDKLLAEVDSLDPAKAAAPGPAAPIPAPAPAKPAAQEAAAPKLDPLAPDVAAVDDLLAEFKETKS